jgi:predicted enzyme related to lactoylglutathione lyase
MPTIDRHKPGSFCWVELGTSDQPAAKLFYTSLLGWDVLDNPMGGPGGVYSMFSLHGRNTGGGYTLMPDMVAQGIPPHWMLYVQVDSADDTVAKVTGDGGKVMGGPFDVMTYGRMAVLQDPTGAVFSIWQPKSHPGTQVVGEPGAFCWADLSTPDVAAAKRFYESVFGWQLSPGEHDTSGYLHIKNGDHFIGGVQPSGFRNPKAPPHWLIYFQVASCDASTAKAKELGASVYMEPMSMEDVGRWSVVADPQGAVFSLFEAKPHA